MAIYASRPAWDVTARAATRARVAVPAGLALLVLLSLVVRTRQLGIGFWIDEGLSVGIADRPLADIPGVLRQDGSPPLYYMLLSLWIGVAGTSEEAVRGLSLLCGTLAIPAAWWAGRTLFDTRTAWVAAVLAATSPFLTQYAQEGRMYALVALLGFFACAAYGRAFAPGAQRGWAILLAVSLAALMYTHNWALFFALACGGVWLVQLARASGERRRELLRAGLLGFGGALLLYLPWVPTLLYQAAHTGAPWSHAPSIVALLGVPGRLLGVMAQGVLAITAGAGIAALLSRREDGRARTVLLLLALGVATMAIAWLSSQLSPAWANRYLAIGLAPFLLPAAVGLAHAGRLGLAGLLVAAALGLADPAPSVKSNVRDVSEEITPGARPGDLVLATQPEQVPVLHYYLPRGLRFATLTGPVRDLGVTDWRDGVERLEAATAEKDLRPLMDAMPAGSRLMLVTPIFFDNDRWTAPWTRAILVRSLRWRQYLSNDRRFRVIAIEPPPPADPVPNPVQALVYVKTRP
jgi:predicted membrane-bound mannosyltransferase